MRPRFFVVAPPLRHSSAGIVVLHELIDDLMALGYETSWVCTSIEKDGDRFNFAAAEGVDSDSAVVIYPEVITGNPLGAKNVVRYLLNYVGAVRGNAMQHGSRDFLLAYMPQYCPYAHAVLTKLVALPQTEHWDQEEFSERVMSATYVGKGGSYGDCFLIPDTIEITRSDPPTRNDLFDLLRHMKFLFSWDMISSINTEASLLGAVPVFMQPAPLPFDDCINRGPWGEMPFGYATLENGVPKIHLPGDLLSRRERLVQFIEETKAQYSSQLVTAVDMIVRHFASA